MSRFASLAVFGPLLLGSACSHGAPAAPQATARGDAAAAPTFTGLELFVAGANEPVVTSFFEFLPEVHAEVHASTEPATAARGGADGALHVAVVTDLTCGECYRVTGSGANYVVHGGNALGAQYGLAELLEATGVRFFHPWESRVPAALGSPEGSTKLDVLEAPAMTLRGLHLHTLHPIESYFAFWASRPSNGGPPPDADVTPGPDAGPAALTGLDGARRVIDWIVKNRGNYVEWAALNDIVTNDANVAAWRAHTSAILTYAHARGIKVGIGTELFGESNFQDAFDLLDDENDPNAQASVEQRWHLLMDGLPWDVVNLSFGAFIGADPNLFLDSLDLAYTELEKIAPGTQLSATVHVGNSPQLLVTYEGKTLLYYFLVQYADPHIVPWIHSVFYFDLFEPADGAYNMTSFEPHRAFLESYLQANKPVGYFPESAYWISFDDSVPTYLPLYMRSRWLDVVDLAKAATEGGYGALQQHVLFTSGWEWGYWQNDYATLRASFRPPGAWTNLVDDMFAPWGAEGAALARLVGALGEIQDQDLIGKAVAAYFGAQDAVVALGAQAGVISQPVRTTVAQVRAMSVDDRAAFAKTVVVPLADLDERTGEVKAAVDLLALDATDPWLSETTDGIAIDAARARFVHSIYAGVVAYADHGDDGGWLAKADVAFADAQAIVARRSRRLHYPAGRLLLAPSANSTSYGSGYLTEAGTLCYWTRERTQAAAIIEGSTAAVPGCVP